MKAWLIYESNQYYDGGDRPLIVCMNKTAGEKAKKRIQAFADRIRERIGFWPEIEDPAYDQILEKRESIITKARWPYGVKFDDVDLGNMGVIGIMELGVVK